MKTLICNCCGQSTKGKQWFNRDKGYGMCKSCLEYVRHKGMSEDEIKECYGIEGVHCGID